MLRHPAQRLELSRSLSVRLRPSIRRAVEDFGGVDGRIEVVKKSTACFELLVADRAGEAAVGVVLGDGFS